MIKKKHNKRYGDVGEFIARLYLRVHGASIIERNFSCVYGEIDIIAFLDGHICFVEVKRRATRAFGSPAQAVNATKRKHIVNCAKLYLKRRGWLDRPSRFDVIQIDGYRITYIRGAFDARM